MTPVQSCRQAPSFWRPTRGAVRLNALYINPEPLQVDLRHLEQAVEWSVLKDGQHWAQIVLLRNEFRHPVLSACPALERAIANLPSRVLDACLKLLGPGGFVHEHRDITGAVPMGVVRLHVPIVTHPDAEFYVNGKRLFLAPGEAWMLDTSYRHRVANRSVVRRIHLVVDLELDRSLRALLPKRDIWDRVHAMHFWLLCFLKGMVHLAGPRHLRRLVWSVIKLRVMRKSTLP
jgi:hypothetical protein